MKGEARPAQHPAPQAPPPRMPALQRALDQESYEWMIANQSPRMPALQRALDQESYEWMSANQPDILRALEVEIGNGARPHQARMMVLQHSGRGDLAARIEQAARHIEAGR